jgi:hypothetical protein
MTPARAKTVSSPSRLILPASHSFYGHNKLPKFAYYFPGKRTIKAGLKQPAILWGNEAPQVLCCEYFAQIGAKSASNSFAIYILQISPLMSGF